LIAVLTGLGAAGPVISRGAARMKGERHVTVPQIWWVAIRVARAGNVIRERDATDAVVDAVGDVEVAVAVQGDPLGVQEFRAGRRPAIAAEAPVGAAAGHRASEFFY
jgi:hypothetical protein